ncbi:MAG: hypothetical protein DELT_01039 [Desulfovibrio sp.]
MVIYTAAHSAVNGARSVGPVQAVPPASSVSPDSRGARESDPFGPAYIRKAAAQETEHDTYTADARMTKELEQRDREVRQTESAKGEAVGDENFIYQVGPNGQRYAIGTAPHAVKDEEEESSGSSEKGPDGEELSENDEELLERLKARDAKVRNHEAAHVMASGGQASMPTYTYQTGPDGKRYAIGGSVDISILSTGDAESDARRAKNAYRAAMAVGEPSTQDMQTASKAQSMSAKSMQEAAAKYAAMEEMY